MMLKCIFCYLLLNISFFSISQSVINGDLESDFSNVSVAPSGWQMVPFDDPNCEASQYLTATPDIYSISGPDPFFGMNGIPYSGNTFVAGGYGFHPSEGSFSQEGIMQTVSGFEIDSLYTIGFSQAVRVRNYCHDPSGSWILIVDDQVIGTSEATYSTIGESNINLEWEKREFVFKATSNVHTLKFLPVDNDNSSIGNEAGELGLPFMGIDSIFLNPYNCDRNLELGSDLTFCEGDNVLLDAYQLNASYQWNTGDTTKSISVNKSGIYAVEVTVYDCPVIDSITYFDTIQVTVVPYPVFDFGSGIQFICSNETLVLEAYSDGSTYLWQDGSNESSFSVSDTGLYYVDVDRQGCHWSDTVKIEFKPCESMLEMPNVFTPNGDGVNDLFGPVKMENIRSLHAIVLNRWGDIVFETDSLLIDWNGRINNGQELSEGIYFWRIDYIDEFGDSFQRDGNVTLIR